MHVDLTIPKMEKVCKLYRNMWLPRFCDCKIIQLLLMLMTRGKVMDETLTSLVFAFLVPLVLRVQLILHAEKRLSAGISYPDHTLQYCNRHCANDCPCCRLMKDWDESP